MFKITLDMFGLKIFDGMTERAEKAVKNAVRDLTAMGRAHAIELATERLKTRRQMFIEALSMTQVDDLTWMIVLDAKVVWIEKGQTKRDLLPQLLRSPKAKTAKDGSKYLVVPFKQGPAQKATPVAQDLIDVVKQHMKQRKIPWSKVESDEHGQPKLGRLHSFDIHDRPIKTKQGPGQGWGPIGQVRQGPNQRQTEGGGPAGGGLSFLSGVSVNQRQGANGKVQRNIMTFRIASSKHQGQGRWQHPGNAPKNILLDTHAWLLDQWENSVGPALVAKIQG